MEISRNQGLGAVVALGASRLQIIARHAAASARASQEVRSFFRGARNQFATLQFDTIYARTWLNYHRISSLASRRVSGKRLSNSPQPATRLTVRL